MIFWLIHFGISNIVTYGSAVQIKGFFTKNRITIEINQTSLLPVILCKRPPYNDGWYWIVDPINESHDVFRQEVRCGDFIKLHNSLYPFYLTVGDESQQRISASKIPKSEYQQQWEVICDGKDEYWTQDTVVQFYNNEENCYVQSGFKNNLGNDVEQTFEVLCEKKPSKETQWRASEGIYFGSESISEN